MQDKKTYASYAKEVNKKIKDPALRELLFGMDEVEATDLKGIGTLYKMMTFAFMFTYAKYKFDGEAKKTIIGYRTKQQLEAIIDEK